MAEKTADEDLSADQILELINAPEEANEEAIDNDNEEVSLRPKWPKSQSSQQIRLIDDNEDIFTGIDNKQTDQTVDQNSKQYNAEELFGEMSDEEFDDRPYLTEEGKHIAHNLKNRSESVSLFETKTSDKPINFWNQKSNKQKTTEDNDDSIRDIFSGIRLKNPLISSDKMRELMAGRKMIKMSLIKTSVNKMTNDIDDDWVTIGVVIGKIGPKVSKNGKNYIIWKLSDLKTKNVVSMFLFGEVYNEYWKLPVSSVVGLLNPKITTEDTKSKYSKNEICSLNIDHPAKVLLMGTAKDLGFCKAMKKDQEVCGALINLAEEDYCVYHVRTAYKKFSAKRAEIQTTFSNVEPKNYSSNQFSYFSSSIEPSDVKDIPLVETKKYNSTEIREVKNKEAEKLSKVVKNPISKAAKNLSLSMTTGSKTDRDVSKNKSIITAKEIFNSINREKNSNGFSQFSTPTLAKGYKSGQMIDLSKKSDSKLKAIQILKSKPLRTEDPNTIKKTQNKRSLDKIISKIDEELKASDDYEESEEEKIVKKQKKDLVEQALNRKSVNEKEVEIAEMKAQDKYFTTLEKKEKMEEKLSQTTELECNVVTCRVCKYTAHSASELCKKSGHRLSRHKATKRFFRCNNCKNRSFAFNVMIPTKPCSKCGQTSYGRTSIVNIKEETTLLDKKLMIRGEEKKFLNTLL